jgi:hypothetical protein
MKIIISLKTPDAVFTAIRQNLAEGDEDTDYDTLYNLCSTWFKYGEYLSVEVDTEQKTCTVLEAQ